MGFHTGKHGKVYNDDKKSKGSSSSHPGNHDGSHESARDDLTVSEKIDLAFQPSNNGNSVEPHLSEYGDPDDGYGLDPEWNRIQRTESFYNELPHSAKIKFQEIAMPSHASYDTYGDADLDDLPESIQEKLIDFNTKTIRYDGWKGPRNTDDFDRKRFHKKYNPVYYKKVWGSR